MYDIPECDEESENEERGKATRDPIKPHDDLPKIITTPPPEDENKFDPAKWLESASGSGLDTPNEPHAGSNSDDNEPIDADRPETTHIEEVPEVHEAKQRPEDKPSSILTLEEASEIVNQVISIGLHSWEFKWSADGDDKKAYRLGWTKVISGVARPMPRRRTSYIVRSPKSAHASAKGNSGSSSQEGRGRPTQKNETKEPLDIAFRPVCLNPFIRNWLIDKTAEGFRLPHRQQKTSK